MALFGSGDNLTLQITQSGKERDGAVPDIIMGAGVTLLQRKGALCAFKSLALTLLVATEHQSALGRVQVQPDNVPEFLFKVRIIGDLKSLQPMWLNFVMVPNPLYRALAHLGFASHRAHTPSDFAMRRSSRSFNDQRDFFRRKSRFATSPRCVRQSPYPVAIKAL